LEQQRIDVRIRARAFAADRERPGDDVVPGFYRRGVPGDEYAGLVGAAAEPGEFRRVELHVGAADQRLHRHAAAEGADGQAVLRRDVVEKVRELQRTRAWHVLHHDRRVAGNVLRKMPRQDAGVGVVAAAGAVADDQVDVLAAVEV